MATHSMIKKISAAYHSGDLHWCLVDSIWFERAIWFSVDPGIIRITYDKEIISMVNLYKKDPDINGLMIDAILEHPSDKILTRREISLLKRGGCYVVDRDVNHYLAFPAKSVGEFLATKWDIDFSALMFKDKPILVVNKYNKDVDIYEPVALIMGLRRC